MNSPAGSRLLGSHRVMRPKHNIAAMVGQPIQCSWRVVIELGQLPPSDSSPHFGSVQVGRDRP